MFENREGVSATRFARVEPRFQSCSESPVPPGSKVLELCKVKLLFLVCANHWENRAKRGSDLISGVRASQGFSGSPKRKLSFRDKYSPQTSRSHSGGCLRRGIGVWVAGIDTIVKQ